MHTKAVAFLHLQTLEFLDRTDNRETQRGVPPTTTNHTDGIKHDGRGMDAARGFASELFHEASYLGKPVLDYSGAPEHGLGGLHPDRSSVIRWTCPGSVFEFTADNVLAGDRGEQKLSTPPQPVLFPTACEGFFPAPIAI
jgi:hypothetical protein